MATRLYFTRRTTSAEFGVTLGVSDSAWDRFHSGGGPYAMSLNKGSGESSISFISDTSSFGAGVERKTRIERFLTPRLATQDISSYYNGVMRVHDSSASAADLSMYFLSSVALVSQDGSVFKQRLTEPWWYDFTEFPQAGTSLSRIFMKPDSGVYLLGAAEAGDRLLIEIGANVFNTSGGTRTAEPGARVGNNQATDLNLSHGSSTDNNPWIEFTQDLIWYDENPVGMVV